MKISDLKDLFVDKCAITINAYYQQMEDNIKKVVKKTNWLKWFWCKISNGHKEKAVYPIEVKINIENHGCLRHKIGVLIVCEKCGALLRMEEKIIK